MDKDLLDIAGRGEVLVFPTEESARAFSVNYALVTGKGLLASSAIAFDKFASMFFPEVEGRTAASDMDRVIFSSYAATELSGRMRYFISPRFPEVRSRLQPYFKSMLQHLDEAKGVSADAEWDLALLKEEYLSFLSGSSLYESAYTEPVMPCLFNEYHLLFPSAFPKEMRLVEFLSGKEHIHIHEAGGFSGEIAVYQSEIEEIRDVFLNIRELVDQGAALSDIVISTAGSERLRYHLLEEARLFDIPLEFVQGSSPLSFPAGAFLSSLQDIYTSRYSIASLKEFFLNPAFPFKDRPALRLFIRRAIDSSISSAPSPDTDRYRRIPDESGGDKYRLLRFALDLLMTEDNPGRVLPMVNQIMTGLLEPGEFNEREEDRNAYSFAMNELTRFLTKVRAARASGYKLETAVFPLFLSYLERARYVPKHKSGGVRVYSFSSDAAVYSPFRFILTLNENDSKKTVKDALFLSDYEFSSPREEMDITQSLLYSYSRFSGTLFLSSSYDTYQGYALPLSSLGKRENKMERLKGDPWSYGERAERVYPLQRLSRERAALTGGRLYRKEESLTGELAGKPIPAPVPLSFSSVDSYLKCPFKYALEYRFALSEIVSYDVSDIDHREIGTRLHAVMERFFKEGGEPDEVIPLYLDDEMRLWQEGRERCGSSLRDMPSSSPRPSPSLLRWIRQKYLQNMIKLAQELSSCYEPAEGGLETSFKTVAVKDPSFVLNGRVDMIARDKESGDFVLVDYKKTMPDLRKDPSKALQFHIYSLLLKSEKGWDSTDAAFAGFNTGSLCHVPLAQDKDELSSKLSKVAQDMSEGKWAATEAKENCASCRFRAVCRTRFTVA